MTEAVDRRQVLVGLGAMAGVGGAALAGASLAGAGLAGPAGALPIGASNTNGHMRAATDAVVEGLTPSVSGVVYASAAGYDALLIDGSAYLVDNVGAGMSPSDANGSLVLPIRVPNGATIVEVHLFASEAYGMQLVENLLGTYSWNNITSVQTPAGSGIQHGVVTGLGTVNDTSSFSLLLTGNPATTDYLQSAAIGYIPASSGFVPVTATRVYDSRWSPAPSGVTVGALTSPNNRVVSVANGRSLSSGAITASNLVPTAATAVAYNLTAVPTAPNGFLAITPGNASTYTASAINWSGLTGPVANGGIAKLGTNRDVKVFCNGGGTADFIIDITGYYI